MTDVRNIMFPAQRIGRASIDALLAVMFWLAWLVPESLGAHAYEWLEGVLVMQVIAVVLAGFMLFKLDLSGPAGLVVAWVVAAMGVIAIGLGADSITGALGMLVPFGLLCWSVFELALSSEMTTVERRMRMTYAGLSALCLIVTAMVVVTFPMPLLGWSDRPLYGTKTPQLLLATGAFYFTAIAVLKYRWRPHWWVPRLPARKRI